MGPSHVGFRLQNYQNQCSIQAGPTNRLPIGWAGWEKVWILIEYSLKNRESIKKTVQDSKFGWGRYDRNKPKCSEFRHAPMNYDWTETLGIGWAGWENIFNFERIFLEEQWDHKKMVHDSEFGWGRYDWNKPKCSVFKHAPMNFDWTETLGIGRSGREQIWNFGKIFLEEQGVHKKNGAQFRVWVREILSKQAQVLCIRTCSYEF